MLLNKLTNHDIVARTVTADGFHGFMELLLLVRHIVLGLGQLRNEVIDIILDSTHILLLPCFLL